MKKEKNQLMEVNSELSKDAIKVSRDLRKHVEAYFGPRCKQRQPGCPTCQAWSAYDVIELFLEQKD